MEVLGRVSGAGERKFCTRQMQRGEQEHWQLTALASTAHHLVKQHTFDLIIRSTHHKIQTSMDQNLVRLEQVLDEELWK